MTEVVPPKGPGKGNRTPGPRNLIGNEGNESPMFLRNKTIREAKPIIDYYNAESTYSEGANNKAATHLQELHTHLTNLGEAMDRQGVPSRSVRRALSSVQEAHEAITRPGGFAAHPDVIGLDEPYWGVHKNSADRAADKPLVKQRGILDDVQDHLSNVASLGVSHSDVQEHLTHAQGALDSYHRSFNPVNPTEYKTHKSDPNLRSYEIDKDYYPHNTTADLNYNPRETEGNLIAEGGTTRISDGRKLEPTREARSARSIRTEAAKKAKGYSKPKN